MRVAIVTHRAPPAQGGVETYVHNLSTGLLRDGYQVTIYTTDLLSCTPFLRLPQPLERRVKGVETRAYWATKPFFGIEATAIPPLLIKDLLKKDIDLIHAQNYVYFPAYASALVNRVKKIPLVLTAHTSPKTGAPPSVRRLYDFTLGRFALNAMNHVIALTQKEKAYLQCLGVSEDAITVIPHGIPLKRFMTPPNPNTFRERYHVTGRMILFVGRLAPFYKGLPYLVHAIPQVLKEAPDTTFVLVGPNAGAKTRLVTLSQGLGVENQVVFTGPLYGEDLVEAYHACDLFVLPSLQEPFGIVLLEAMAAGAPIVASNVDGIPEVVAHKENGLLVPPRDVDGLAHAITTMLQDPDQAQRFAQTNQTKARNFSLEKTLHATENVYQQVTQATT